MPLNHCPPPDGSLLLFAAPIGRLPLPQPLPSPKLPIKKLTPVEIQEKRDRGLYFSCDEKYSPNHCCKNRVMVLLGKDEDMPLNALRDETDSSPLEEGEIET